MSRYNRGRVTPLPSSPVFSEAAPGAQTALGAQGYMRDLKSELYVLASCYMPDEKTLHEGRDARVARWTELVRANASADPDWAGGLLNYLRARDGGNLRLGPVYGAAEFARARKEEARYRADPQEWTVRKVTDAVLQRGDEPGELVAYWITKYGRNSMPKGLKRGIADALPRLYTEYAVAKYDTPSAAVRFGDVIEIVNARYNTTSRGTCYLCGALGHHAPGCEGDPQYRAVLWKYLIARRHDQDAEIPAVLRVLRQNKRLMRDPSKITAESAKKAGMTWERAASHGEMTAGKWEAAIPSMPYMALRRNLANFDRAGISDAVAAKVAARLADPEAVAKSGEFPFAFWLAYRNAPSLRWAWPLSQALDASLSNVTPLRRPLVLVDRSPSMWQYKMTEQSDMDWADAAALFGAALAVRADNADLAEFWAHSKPVPFGKGESVLKIMEKFSVKPAPGGTDIPAAVRDHLKPYHTEVVILTDEQTRPGWLPSNCMQETLIDDLIPKTVPVYMWNFAGYKTGALPSGGSNRHTFGGLTDAAFRLITALQAGKTVPWPWLAESGTDRLKARMAEVRPAACKAFTEHGVPEDYMSDGPWGTAG